MMDIYLENVMKFYGTYQDEYGLEKIHIHLADNGHEIKIVIRDVEFIGSSFARLSSSPAKANLDHFVIDDENHLCSFRIICEMPILVIHQEQTIEGQLKMNCRVCSPEEEWEKAAYLQLTLCYNGQIVQSDWCGAGFEEELYNLEKKLPKGIYIKACFNCRFADYNPYVNSGLMGELACFVHTEDKDVIRGKGYDGWRHPKPVLVQELHLCSQFQPNNLILAKPWSDKPPN